MNEIVHIVPYNDDQYEENDDQYEENLMRIYDSLL